MTFAEALNAALDRARAAASDGPEQELERQYLRVLRALVRDLVRRFQDITPEPAIVATALSPVGTMLAAANWPAPSVDEVLRVAMNTARIRDAQRVMLAHIAGPIAGVEGVDFNLTHPVVQDMLDKLGARVEGTIRAGVREPVARAIADGWAKGLSVPDTAKQIRASVSGVIDWQAQMLARTDLNSLSNGSGHWAADQLNAGAKANNEPLPIGSKTWTSAGDSRVRPSHQEADGQTVPMDQPFMVGGFPLSYPGDPAGPHDEVVNCRCVEIFNEPAARGGREDVQAEAGPPPEPKEKFAARINTPGHSIHNPAALDSLNRAVTLFDEALPGGMTPEMVAKLEPVGGKLAIRMRATHEMEGAHGEYRFIGGSPANVAMSAGTPSPYNTVWHELGHYLDHQALGPGVGQWGMANRATDAVRGFLDAIEETAAIREIRAHRAADHIRIQDGRTFPKKDQTNAYLDYLVGPDEMWARSFAQWMIRHHGDELARAEHDQMMFDQRGLAHFVQEQWEDDDFDLIDGHVEAVLREAGLLDDLGLTAAFWRVVHDVHPRLLPGVELPEPLTRLFLGQVGVRPEQLDQLLVGPSSVTHGNRVEHAGDGSPPLGRVPSSGPQEVPVKTTHKLIPRMFTGPQAVLPVLTLQAAATDDEGRTMWHSDMCFEGIPTGDGRFMVAGSLRSRELPLTLMAMIETPDFGGHAGAEVAGRIDTFTKRDQDMNGGNLPDGVQAVYSTGVFDQGDFAQNIERMVGDEIVRGISVDLAVHEWAFRDPDTGELIDPMEATDEQWERAFMGELEFAVVEGEVMASTICPTPAFADARIAILASGVSPSFARTWLAGAEYAALTGVTEGQLMTTLVTRVRPVMEVVRASAAAREGIAPLKPDRDGFFVPEPDGPQPITVDEHGQLTGHLALWETCHTGYANGEFATCVTPPRSGTDYGEFHLMPLVCADGSQVLVGKLTVGTGHADPHLGVVPARAHYDNTGTIAAYVRAIDGKHGVWLSGWTRSDMTDEQLRDLRVNPPSGDWRGPRGALELLAALAVVCPGFPVPQIGLAADAQGMFMSTLILAGGATMGPTLDPVDAAVLDASMNGPEGLDALIQE